MRMYIRVKGHVQGIGYRYFVIQSAQKHSLTGWVRNCSNGDVEGEAQGDENELRNFLGHLESGHAWARVDSVRRETIPEKKDEAGFDIRT
jgi:acylphosphatase